MVIVLVLAIIGIMYILEKSPRSEVKNYEKTTMPTPSYSRHSSGSFFSDLSSSASGTDDDDTISLTGKSRRYEEVRIGGSTDQ